MSNRGDLKMFCLKNINYLKMRNEELQEKIDNYHKYEEKRSKMLKRIENSKIVFDKIAGIDNLYIDDKLELGCELVIYNARTAIENFMIQDVSRETLRSEFGVEIVGYITLDYFEEKSHSIKVDKLYVGPKYRRKGFATKMLERLKEFGKANNIKVIRLTACADNGIEQEQLLEFYKKCGFKEEVKGSNRMICELL